MPSYCGMRCGGGIGTNFVLPATIRAWSMHSINTLSMAWPLFLYNAYSSSLLFTIFRSFHSGFLQKRTWWQMQRLVMITLSLLTWVCRYLTTSLTQRPCARSCIPSLQLPHSKYKTESQENTHVLQVLLQRMSLHSLPSLH